MKKHISRSREVLIAAIIALLASTQIAAAADIEWSKYFTSSALVSAIASAMSQVERCSVPLTFVESHVNGSLRLSITCAGGEEENATSVIEFDDLGGTLMPSKFYFAG